MSHVTEVEEALAELKPRVADALAARGLRLKAVMLNVVYTEGGGGDGVLWAAGSTPEVEESTRVLLGHSVQVSVEELVEESARG